MSTPADSVSLHRMDRRDAIRWMVAAATTAAVLDPFSFAAEPGVVVAKGYGTDPDLLKTYQPGELWRLTFNDEQRAIAVVLCDVIIPADSGGPAASRVKVHDFIDEWISAPYPGHDLDRKVILDGLAWIEAEAQKRFGAAFVNLVARQRNAICDDVCFEPKAKPEFKTAARFFRRFRDLTAGGYYTTPEGMKDIGYTGNVPLDKFEGPPPEVLQKLGLA